MSFTGELISLGTAFCWTFTVVAFETAGKRVGSLSVNIIRLLFGFVLLGITLSFMSGSFIPFELSNEAWMWLSISGLVGLVIGDLFLFQAFVDLGGRISLLILCSVPVLSAILGLIFFNEVLTWVAIVGMVITLSAISLVILLRQNGEEELHPHVKRGIAFAFIGAISQAVGLLLSKQGLADNSAFAATQIRVISAIFGFVIFITIRKGWKDVRKAFSDKKAMGYISVGSFFGPFLGVSSSLLALQYTSLGVSTTIAQTNVILIIPFSVILFKEKVNLYEILAALFAFLGVAVLIFAEPIRIFIESL